MGDLASLRAELTPLQWGVLWDPFRRVYRATNARAYVEAPTAEELLARVRTTITPATAEDEA